MNDVIAAALGTGWAKIIPSLSQKTGVMNLLSRFFCITFHWP
jgi:hypothetical protein